MATRRLGRNAWSAAAGALATLALLWAFGGGSENGERVRKVGPLSAFSITAKRTMSTRALRNTCATTGTGRDVFMVTGAAGFIGSHVATALKGRGDGVVGLDNVNDYYPRGLKRARMKKLKEIGVHVVEACLLYTSPSPRDA